MAAPPNALVKTTMDTIIIFQLSFFSFSILLTTESPANASNGVVVARKSILSVIFKKDWLIGVYGMLNNKAINVAHAKAGSGSFGNQFFIWIDIIITTNIAIAPGRASRNGIPFPIN